MTLAADLLVMFRCCCSPGNVVRVVARRAAQAARAHLKTGRAPQPVTLAGDLEFLIGRNAIEVEHKIGKWLTGLVRKRSSLITDNRIRQAVASGFEVALEADFHLAVGTEARGINNGPADFFACGSAAS